MSLLFVQVWVEWSHAGSGSGSRSGSGYGLGLVRVAGRACISAPLAVTSKAPVPHSVASVTISTPPLNAFSMVICSAVAETWYEPQPPQCSMRMATRCSGVATVGRATAGAFPVAWPQKSGAAAARFGGC